MERRGIFIRGSVQGVGFRPFVHALASGLKLDGFVRNQTGGVRVEVEGDAAAIDRFQTLLKTEHPPLARVDQLICETQPIRGERGFRIEASQRLQETASAIGADAATCADCLTELFDPANRRYGHPFINCVNCGPRLTIITGIPYDRAQTTMARFQMCRDCEAEYQDPADRRFHAQANACPKCGPQLILSDATGKQISAADPIELVAGTLLEGKIAAIKGLGGYHLCCDALNDHAVAQLRLRKRREEKPFAVMVKDLAVADAICHIDACEGELLQGWRRPIVLLRKRDGVMISGQVAPANPYLGVMLPYTPVHHLLMHAVGGRPLVMTSGNRSDEPIACDKAEAQERLHEIAHLFLHNDRPIHVRCDDSVAQVVGGQQLLIRRSRGYAPQTVSLPLPCSQPLLALGGQLKATFAIGRQCEAIVSHHLGDLDQYQAYRQYQADIELYQTLFEVEPRCLIHDLHPDYASTRYALSRPAPMQLVAVQHHHAHLASCLADNDLNESAIGVIFDGSGFGSDGTIWGGEFLIGDLKSFRRAGHLRYVPLPGGEAAVREPWRIAASYLLDAGVDFGLLAHAVEPHSLRLVAQMIDKRLNSPLTSSAGRLFDAIASLAAVRQTVTYEGQAAVQLEHLASRVPADGNYNYELQQEADEIIVDTRPLIRNIAREVVDGVDSVTIARRFHSTLVDLVSAVCNQLRRQTGLQLVALSGGVFMNALLSREVSQRLTHEGFRVLQQRRLSANDGGLSFGQLAVGAAQLACEQL